MLNLGRRFVVVAALSLGPAVANSFARFAYALLLPAMRSELALDYAQAGALNTANALGYLAGALFCARYVSRLGNRRLFCAGLLVTVSALVGSGLTGAFIAQLSLRALAGASGAMVFICGAVLASNLVPDRAERSSSAIAVYFGGAGAGIVISGVGIPWLLAVASESAWRTGWLAIGGVSAAFAVMAIGAARRIDEPSNGARKSQWPTGAYHAALGSYFLIGVGYIAYMTFVVAWMASHGASAVDVALTWGTLGVATMVAPIAWRVPRSRWPAAKMLAGYGGDARRRRRHTALQRVASRDGRLGAVVWRRDVHGPHRRHRSRQDVAAEGGVGIRSRRVHRGVRARAIDRAGPDGLARGCHAITGSGPCGVGRHSPRSQRSRDVPTGTRPSRQGAMCGSASPGR
jgi:MFS family permease